ncbi:hypothetical protein ACVWXP_004233 [Bradyrhizobium sp. USDA 4463]
MVGRLHLDSFRKSTAQSGREARRGCRSKPARRRSVPARRYVRCALLATTLWLAGSAAFAEESAFAFVYTTDLLPQGGKEVEQWVTWRHQKNSGTYDQIEGRTEFEYGLASNLQAAIYLNYAWTQAYHNGPFGATTPPEQFSDYAAGPDDFFNAKRFTGVSGELIYRILSPYTDGIGLALYTEPTVGPNFFEVENKIIVQKNFMDDLLTVAFNFTWAPEFRNTLADPIDPTSARSWGMETDINFGFAASYRFMPNWSAGFEFMNEHEVNSFWFNHESNNGYYLGPTLHYGGERFFLTATALWQMPWATNHTDTVPGALVNGYIGDNDFERFRFRMKAGYTF